MTDQPAADALDAQPPRYEWDGELDYTPYVCGNCDRKHPSVCGFVSRDNAAHGFYRATPAGPGEVWYDITLFWLPDGADEVVRDVWFRVWFGAGDAQEPGFSLNGGLDYRGGTEGLELDRDAALAHPRVPDLWDLVDWLYDTDPMMHQVRGHRHEVTEENWPAIALGDDHAGGGRHGGPGRLFRRRR